MLHLNTTINFTDCGDRYSVCFSNNTDVKKRKYTVDVCKNNRLIYTAQTDKFANKTQAKYIIERAIEAQKNIG